MYTPGPLMVQRQDVGVDLSSGGDWLFREGELVLGPLHAYQLVEKLYSGELTGRSLVSPMGENRFRPVAETDFFKVHLAKAEAKLRVEAAARAEQAKVRKKRAVLIGAVAGVAVLLAGAAAAAAQYLAVHDPFGSDDAFANEIQIEPPKITLARAQPRNQEELLEYDGYNKKPTGAAIPDRSGTRPAGTGSGATKPAAGAARTTGTVSTDPDGMETATFDQDAINSVVNSNQRKLFTCFREEATRNPGFAARIPMEFVIGNNGRVSKLWIDNPSFKQGPLADCLLRELQKWPFKSFEGEAPTVSLSFTIGKPRG